MTFFPAEGYKITQYLRDAGGILNWSIGQSCLESLRGETYPTPAHAVRAVEQWLGFDGATTSMM